MTKKNSIYLTAALALCLLAACSSESPLDETRRTGIRAEITGSIGSADVVVTKATEGNGDEISYASFDGGDAIGFFSEGGLTARNEKLTYANGSFKGAEGDGALIWKEGTADKVYGYYPYSASTVVDGTEYPVSIWRPAAGGKWKEGFEDFLAASANNVSNGSLISMAFSHQFAMLIVKRGAGFDTNNSDISLRLNYPLGKTARISRKNGNTVLLLQQDETQEGIRQITGNPGTYKPAGAAGAGDACVYAIVPVGDVYKDGVKQEGALVVESVTLENNAGIEMTVPMSLSTGALKANTKYLVTVRMRDNQAVIEPEEIRRWEDEEISIVKPAGIENPEDFQAWMATYNNLSTPDRERILAKYGTLDRTTGRWTFLLLGDISYSFASEATAVITHFTDRLDGQGHTVSGLSLRGASHAGFFGTLSGEVANLTLHNIRIEKADGATSGHYGALAGEVTSTGGIENCHITGDASFVVGTGATGGLAGTCQAGGTITDCTSTAVVSGTDPATTGLLVGTDAGGTITGCTTTGTLIVIP